jgi:hypothetical protein
LLAAQDFATVIEISDKPAPSLFSANAFALIDAGGEYFSSAMKVVHSGLARFPSEINLTGIGVDLSLAQIRARKIVRRQLSKFCNVTKKNRAYKKGPFFS